MKMEWKTRAVIVIVVLLTLAYLPSGCVSENYSASYELYGFHGSTEHYRLNVVVPDSLYEYYSAAVHQLVTENDFAKFVTPYALKPIADSLLQIYPNNEDLVNGALMIVHQIPYQVVNPPEYPVETIANNRGDCDLLSYVFASILKASGIDVVLFYYEHESHMNVGVYLASPPQDSREDAYYMINDGKRYYMAECTGNNWQDGWRVGECPEELKNASLQVITLKDNEQAHTGQVSASYRALTETALTLHAGTYWVVQGSTVSFEGELSPPLQGRNITVYVRANNSPWTVLGTATVDSTGKFGFSWNVDPADICYVRVSWSGDEDFAASDSPVLTIVSLSTFFVLFLTVIVALIVLGIVTYLSSRRSYRSLTGP